MLITWQLGAGRRLQQKMRLQDWGTDGSYQRVMYSYDTWAWGYYNGSVEQRDEANRSFDTVYSEGGIYHLVDHPWTQLWSDGSYLVQHLNYISNRPDIWYAAFGELYLYHFVQERGLVSVTPLDETLPSSTPTPPRQVCPQRPVHLPRQGHKLRL